MDRRKLGTVMARYYAENNSNYELNRKVRFLFYGNSIVNEPFWNVHDSNKELIVFFIP